MARKKNVTLKDIADRLGLTVHTVSKALRGREGMSEETRRLIFRTAGELGYRTKAQEYSIALDKLPLFPQKPHRFAFIASWNGEMVNLLYEGLQERMYQLGHQLEFHICPPAITSHPRSLEQWVEQYGITYVSGMFIAPALMPELERKLLDLPVPKIMLNFPEAGMETDSIIWDVYDAMARSVNYLAESGHRRILYIGDIEKHRGFRRRWQSFIEALHLNGIHTDPYELVLQPEGTQEQWTQAFIAKWENLRPTAMICAIEHFLPWLYVTCNHLHISIPEDVSVISLETSETPFISNLTHPSLPVRETGFRAADRMLWRLANPHMPYEHLRLQCRWYRGDTVKQVNPAQS